jgi:glutathione S-transferase
MAGVLTAGGQGCNEEDQVAITMWGRDTSANVQKVRWALAELGLPYEHIQLGGRYGGNRTPDYLALNPQGLVPTLRDDDLVLWESHAIVRYLAAKYGAGRLWPERIADRAESDRWTDWTATTLQPAWIETFYLFYRTAPGERDGAAIAQSREAAERAFALIDGRLAATRFLAGDQLTYADIVAGISMFRWTTMGLEGRKSFANVDRWHADLRARATYRDTVEIDYSELKGKPTN